MNKISAVKVEKKGKVVVLIFGGYYNKQGKVYTLDLETMESGTLGGDVKYQRNRHSNSSINNDVYLFGGKYIEVDKFKFFNDL